MMPEKMNIINEKKTVTAERKVYMPFFKWDIFAEKKTAILNGGFNPKPHRRKPLSESGSSDFSLIIAYVTKYMYID